MPLTHYTDRHLVRLLSTDSRRADASPHDLSRSHVALGRFLAGELVEHLAIEPCDILHPQGVRQGFRLADERAIVVVVLMRGGLYVAEGAREILRVAPMLHVRPARGEGLGSAELAELDAHQTTTCILIDSVVNTGASIEPILAQLSERGLRKFVLSLVAPTPTADRLARVWPDVRFLFARVSDNQYVGQGSTDTGNRLFGTIPPAKEPS